jgi:cytidyltransferase-like protein
MYKILHGYNPDWTDVAVEKNEDCLTNEVFFVTNNTTKEKVLVRKFLSLGPKTISLIQEIPTAPKILFYCDTGTVEEFIYGHTMTYEEMISPKYSAQIAVALRKLHDSGFIHLDLHHKNMIVDVNNNVRFVDFEYAEKSDDIYIDLANHFCEYSYQYDTDDWYCPKQPTNMELLMNDFLTHYLGHSPDFTFVMKIREQMFNCHVKWVKWALDYYEMTGTPYYLHYAEHRARVDKRVLNIFGKTVYVDGTFDLLHPGHIAFMKKSREFTLCKRLIVGVMSDQAVESYKRVPIHTCGERINIISNLEIVDEALVAPFNEEFTADFLDKHKIDYVVYGGDPKLGSTALGTWSYHYREALARNIVKMVDYTAGFSTTKSIEKMANNK